MVRENGKILTDLLLAQVRIIDQGLSDDDAAKLAYLAQFVDGAALSTNRMMKMGCAMGMVFS